MDLVLWRHAEAKDQEPGGSDLERPLTTKGHRQAQRMAAWLDRQLPSTTRVYCSPALRTMQTVEALGRPFQVKPVLAPDASPIAVRELVGWPSAQGTALVVGHQPTLGQIVAQLLGVQEAECPVRKGAVWWLRYRVRDGVGQTVLVSVQTPDMLG